MVEHQQAPIYSPPVPIGIAPPAGLVPPFGAGIGLGMIPPMPFVDPFMYRGGGPLAPIRSGKCISQHPSNSITDTPQVTFCLVPIPE